MAVVSDTSPLRYFIAAGHADVVRPVLSELTHPSTPVVPGEAAAIQIAGELKADLLLIDERIGRREASRYGVPVVGALGVLLEAFRRGLIADPLAVVVAMRAGGFRVSKRLLDRFQDEVASIRQGGQC
jgi:predicted nucleic acid-binding protein